MLANEEVQGGVSERGGHPVVRMPLRQWMLRITTYADRLEKDLDRLDWPESIKALQRNWIGRSTGAEVDFFIGADAAGDGKPSTKAYETWKADRAGSGWPGKPGGEVLRVYTTRPDTLFGATYMVVAPEHPFVERLTTPEQAGGGRRLLRTGRAEERPRPDRSGQGQDRRVHRLLCDQSGQRRGRFPIWVADYVLISYGTGAIMAVPAHDTRDFEFAQQFDLPIIAVVDPGDNPEVDRDAVLAGRQVSVGRRHGDQLRRVQRPDDGRVQDRRSPRTSPTAGLGRSAVNYKLRDWLFSRQHFWGEPFPILHELDAQGKPTGRVRAVAADAAAGRLARAR